MDRRTYNKHRAFAGVLLLILLFAGSNYYLDFGFLERRHAKGVLLLSIGIFVVYGSFFAPTRKERKDMSEHSRGASKKAED